MSRLVLAVAIIWAITGSGCTRLVPVAVVEPLPLPPRPVLPILTGADLECLTDDAYRRLLDRDLLRRAYAEELEAIIRSTHED